MMDSVTCSYLFGHKDLVESHLKQQYGADARKVRGMKGRGGGIQGEMTADLFGSFE